MMLVIKGNVTDKAYEKLNKFAEYIDLAEVRIKASNEHFTENGFSAYKVNSNTWVVTYVKDKEKVIDTRTNFDAVLNLLDKIN